MNFLAHLYLAEPTPACRVGNVLGDFVRGRINALTAELPAPLVAGILRHRTLDRFTDAHPVAREARSLVAPERGRFAGVVVDIAYDHVLARQWNDWAGEPLPSFLRGEPVAVSSSDLAAAFALTGYFLRVHVLEPRGLALPEAREAFLAAAGRERAA